MSNNAERLWDPRYALLGTVTIALTIFILDALPAIIRGRIARATRPPEKLMDLDFLADKE